MKAASELFAADVQERDIELQVVADHETGSVLVARSAGDSAIWEDGRPIVPQRID